MINYIYQTFQSYVRAPLPVKPLPWSLQGLLLMAATSSSARCFFLGLCSTSARPAVLEGMLPPLSLRFSFSLSLSFSLCFLDFLGFLLVLLGEGGLVTMVEVTVRDVRG